MIAVTDLPLINAVLNGTSATLLCAGYYFIRKKNISLHRRCMLLALVSSTLFLVSYLTYHIPGRFDSLSRDGMDPSGIFLNPAHSHDPGSGHCPVGPDHRHPCSERTD